VTFSEWGRRVEIGRVPSCSARDRKTIIIARRVRMAAENKNGKGIAAIYYCEAKNHNENTKKREKITCGLV